MSWLGFRRIWLPLCSVKMGGLSFTRASVASAAPGERSGALASLWDDARNFCASLPTNRSVRRAWDDSSKEHKEASQHPTCEMHCWVNITYSWQQGGAPMRNPVCKRPENITRTVTWRCTAFGYSSVLVFPDMHIRPSITCITQTLHRLPNVYRLRVFRGLRYKKDLETRSSYKIKAITP